MAETLRELVVALSPELKRSKARPRRLRMRRRWFCRAARAIWRQPGAVRVDGVDRDCGPQGRCPGGVIRVAARWAVLRSRKRGERVIRNKRRADAKQGPSAPIENAGKRTTPAPGLRRLTLRELYEANGSVRLPRRFCNSLAHEGNRRNEYAGLPAPADMGCHTGAGKEKTSSCFH